MDQLRVSEHLEILILNKLDVYNSLYQTSARYIDGKGYVRMMLILVEAIVYYIYITNGRLVNAFSIRIRKVLVDIHLQIINIQPAIGDDKYLLRKCSNHARSTFHFND